MCKYIHTHKTSSLTHIVSQYNRVNILFGSVFAEARNTCVSSSIWSTWQAEKKENATEQNQREKRRQSLSVTSVWSDPMNQHLQARRQLLTRLIHNQGCLSRLPITLSAATGTAKLSLAKEMLRSQVKFIFIAKYQIQCQQDSMTHFNPSLCKLPSVLRGKPLFQVLFCCVWRVSTH